MKSRKGSVKPHRDTASQRSNKASKIKGPLTRTARKAAAWSETLEQRKAHALRIIEILREQYPDAHCSLTHSNPFELMIATILSAQCTDARVNIVTPPLFKRFPNAKAFAEAPLEEIEKMVKTTGFYRNKAKNIQENCKILVEKYGGEVPRTLEQLIQLPGVGRKTANVILGNAFGVPGIVVDTHVGRLSYRMGLAVTPQAAVKNAEVIERELEEIIPKEYWTDLAHWLIEHGRQICDARKPKCEFCPVQKLCPKIGL